MGQLLLILISALVVGAVVFGVSVLITGGDPGLEPAEPDGRAVPMPTSRPLVEEDVARARFDLALRGYRMAQVDQAMSRMAYDIGYKDELIDVLQAEVAALRSGRFSDAEVLRRAREAALSGGAVPAERPDLTTESEAFDTDAFEPEASAEPQTRPEVEPAAAEAAEPVEPEADETAPVETASDETASDGTALDGTAPVETALDETALDETASDERFAAEPDDAADEAAAQSDETEPDETEPHDAESDEAESDEAEAAGAEAAGGKAAGAEATGADGSDKADAAEAKGEPANDALSGRR